MASSVSETIAALKICKSSSSGCSVFFSFPDSVRPKNSVILTDKEISEKNNGHF